jgi:hypothetical protein
LTGVTSADATPLDLYLGCGEGLVMLLGLGLFPLNLRIVYLELKGEESFI